MPRLNCWLSNTAKLHLAHEWMTCKMDRCGPSIRLAINHSWLYISMHVNYENFDSAHLTPFVFLHFIYNCTFLDIVLSFRWCSLLLFGFFGCITIVSIRFLGMWSTAEQQCPRRDRIHSKFVYIYMSCTWRSNRTKRQPFDRYLGLIVRFTYCDLL